VSFENQKSEIYVQDIYTQQRSLITSFRGINGAPEWSPDGRRLAIVLSKDGQPDIYVVDVASKRSLESQITAPSTPNPPGCRTVKLCCSPLNVVANPDL
jgi:Tol biopolymer transport system component